MLETAAASSPRAAAAAAAAGAAAAAASASAAVSSPRRGGGAGHHHRRWAPVPYRACLVALWLVGFALVFLWQSTSMGRVRLYTRPPMPKRAAEASMGQWVASPPVYDLREFGAVGNGRTVNTAAFEAAVAAIDERGGGRLTVPAGRWLTAPFNLTSRMTLFLAAGAEILGIQLMRSSNIIISNITLRDSPFWTLHTYDCKNVTISETTILAPIAGAPNTDGIDPDSCENVVIKNCYISVGDDGIAIKSGWDQYGIAYGRPSANIIIQNVVIRSMVSAGVSIGSEMSGGVSDVLVENVHVWDSRRGVRIKTAPGRGAYVSNIAYRNISLENVRVGIVIKTDYNEHPDEGFDPKAVPIIENISYTSIHGHRVRVPVRIQGSAEIPVKNVTFHDMSVGIVDRKNHVFQCSFVQGQVIGYVFPVPCKNLDQYNERRELVKQSTFQNISDIDYSF
ncbi:putative polygalacturonase [Dichanthelium oligosanthes]|uniref:Putative polygalacturonase n=1 Tax=Dichanthelium oligosanthes TaxID=888268 RepID=A0A1E5VZZ6_9POAL|nr:putative polygalacturonase [Dichanthelium oligosanthes]